MGITAQLFAGVVNDLLTSWDRLQEDAQRIGNTECPDLALTLAEAQLLRRSWQAEVPAYLRTYLDNGRWGKDAIWEELVRHAYALFLGLYLLPDHISISLLKKLSRGRCYAGRSLVQTALTRKIIS